MVSSVSASPLRLPYLRPVVSQALYDNFSKSPAKLASLERVRVLNVARFNF